MKKACAASSNAGAMCNCFNAKMQRKKRGAKKGFKETLNKWIPFMVRCFDRLSITTDGINNLPFVLSLSKDLLRVSLNKRWKQVFY